MRAVAGLVSADRQVDTAGEHRVWSTLYQRQSDLLAPRACDAFLKGLSALDLNSGGIPDFAAINPRLESLTGWRVVAVPGLIPDAAFFELLARRRFPAAAAVDPVMDPLGQFHAPDLAKGCAGQSVHAVYLHLGEAGEGGAHRLGQLLDFAPIYRLDHGLSAWEMTIQRADAHTGAARDLFQAHVQAGVG